MNEGRAIQTATELFEAHIPANTTIVIETPNSRIMHKYIYRLTYTSKNSGRTMCMVAKGDYLPLEDGELFRFYLRQLILTPVETAREFSRVYFLERRAKQEEFLFGSKNIRVAGKTEKKNEENGAEIQDKLTFKDYI